MSQQVTSPLPTFSESAQNYYNVDSDSDEEDGSIIFHDLELFCHAINEPQLTEKFINQKVTLSQLLHFDENDLVKCGIELVGERKKILSSIGQMHCERWSPESLNDMTETSLLSSPGIYLALNDINRHLDYIGVTFTYLRKRIETRPEILELGKDFVGVKKIASELDDLVNTSVTMNGRLRMLRRLVDKKLAVPTLKPANHIDKRYLRTVRFRQCLIPTLLSVLIFCASIKLVRSIRL